MSFPAVLRWNYIGAKAKATSLGGYVVFLSCVFILSNGKEERKFSLSLYYNSALIRLIIYPSFSCILFYSKTDMMDMNGTRHGIINNPRGETLFLVKLK